MLDGTTGVANQLDESYKVRAGLGGMTAYPHKAMALVCILLEA